MAGQISADAAHSLKWKRYPVVLAEGDAELVFPPAEGDQGAESDIYYVASR